ncbi:MAG: CAAD domain-containing protein [Synechococcus sp.]|nr:CAAD domain-containing protein [Synechococcus sp.]
MVDSSSPAPAPESAPAPDEAPGGEGLVSPVATTVTVPPLEGEAAEGGEWQLLVSKVQEWFASGAVHDLWQQLRSPLIALAALIGVLMVLKVYAGVMAALQSLPLLPGLLELVGVIWVVRFAAGHLVHSADRQALLECWGARWESFRGRR